MDFPVLSWMIFLLLAGMIAVMLLPRGATRALQWTSVLFTVLPLVLSLWMLLAFDWTLGSMQFVERASWIPTLSIQYALGVDGIFASGRDYREHCDRWIFVRDRDIARIDIEHHYVNRNKNVAILHYSTVIGTSRRDHGRKATYITGPSREDVPWLTNTMVISVPIKETDRRQDNFLARHGVSGATELDALEALHPGELAKIIRQAVAPYRDADAESNGRRILASR